MTFPLVSDFGFAVTQNADIVEHRFGENATLSVQRFFTGMGPRRFIFHKSVLSQSQRTALLNFYNSVQGSFQSFTYNAPNPDGTTTAVQVFFDTVPLSVQQLASMCRTSLTFVEVFDPTTAPTYTVNSTSLRFPGAGLLSDLLGQVQQIIPLIHIKVRDTSVPDIYLSDRRVTVGGQLYLPRVIGLNEQGSDSIMSQDIKGTPDNVRFTFGNADRVMSTLCQLTSLRYASIDLTFARVRSSGTAVDLLQFWSGIILTGTVDGSAQFSVQCSDGLYPINQQYPRRTASRKCWKVLNDGLPYANTSAVNCPYAVHGDPTADHTKCDYYFNTPNGCLSHGMSTYFGGIFAIPQSVWIRDEGTGHLTIKATPFMLVSPIFGLFHWTKNNVTSTSIVSDSIWGTPLAEIWCHDGGDPKQAMMIDATVVAVRDESTFEDVLGIVGAGPLGAYEGMSVQTNADGFKFIVAPLADGFPPQGFEVDSQLRITGYHPTLGLREVLGTDPADATTDPFSLGQGTPQRWDVPDPVFSNILTGQVHDIIPLSAGVAFVELRYSKDAGKGIAPTSTGSHSMTVPVAQGLTGATFDVSLVRTMVTGLTSTFWVAANSYLRALGLDRAPSATQSALLDVPSIIAAAAIADASVPPIITGPNVVQYPFQGRIAELKVFRDWLTEILTCALGYYTFDFGKLRVGIRSNASSTAAFTLGNMLYQSLTISPAEAAFEYLKLEFGNAALQYQMDYADYEDKDFSQYMGRAGAPLSSRQRSVGLAQQNQALLLAATRTREEIGGILRPDLATPYIEFDNNGLVTFQTTILACDTYVGQVVSITHPDLPTYPGPVGGAASPAHTWKYRIMKWTLHKDWSVTVVGKSVTDSMYDLTVGPKPADVTPPAPSILFFAEPLGQWAPNSALGAATDALYPSEYSFDIRQTQTPQENGGPIIQAVVQGVLPVNGFIPGCGAPDVKKGSITQSTTGGHIAGNLTYRVQVCATDSAGRCSPPSDILIVQVPTGTATNQFSITGIQWPALAGLTGYIVYASDQDDLVCQQKVGALSGTVGTYAPTTITITAAFQRSTTGVPNPAISLLRIKARRLIHGGVLGAGVSSAPSSTTITCTDAIDITAADNWAGRALAVIGRPLHNPTYVPFQAFGITSFAAATGVFTLDRNPSAAGVLTDDVVVVCFLGYDNSANPYNISDSGLSNATNSHTGETANDPNRIGNYVQIIKGLGRGQSAKITANTSTGYTLATPITIDATSVWIVVTAAWEYQQDVPLTNSDPAAYTISGVNVSNYPDLPIVVEVVTVNLDGIESPQANAPLRMLWVFGAQGTDEFLS